MKTDKFAQEVGHTFEVLAEHRSETIRWVLIAVAVLIIGTGVYFYRNHQAAARELALAEAMKIDDAEVGDPKPPLMNFATAEEKRKARDKAYLDLSTKYRGTQEGTIGGMYVAAAVVDKGDLPQAEKLYKDLIDSAPAPYASLCKIALADVYAGEGKPADAEKLLRDLVAHPTVYVSKEQATVKLAEFLAKTNPAEARKLLEPLKTGRTAISRVAVAALGTIPQYAGASKN